MTAQEFAEKINDIWTKTKTGKLRDRQARFAVIERLVDEYIAKNGKRPEPEQLDRLATLCLYEEVTDNDRLKIRNNEFPFLSDRQKERRDAELVTQTWSKNIGADGRDYQKQTRHYRKKLRNL